MTRDRIAALTPLSPIQQGLLFHALAEPTPGLYTEQAVCALDGPLDVEAFRRAWAFLVARHDALRAAFVWRGVTQPVQVFYRDVPFEIAYEPHADGTDADARTAHWLEHGRRIAHALGTPPLMRLALLETGPGRHRAIWSIHHLVHDAWSLSILLNELIDVYAALARGRQPALPAAGSYAAFIGSPGRSRAHESAAFWRAELEGARPDDPFRLLPGRAPAAGADPFDRVAADVGEETGRAIDACLRCQGITLNTLAIAAWALTLGQQTSRTDVLFGVTTAGRSADHPGIERLVGLFINTLPLRVRLDSLVTVDAWLRALQQRQLAIVQHESTALADVRAWAGLPARGPLFESLVVCQNALERFEGRDMGAVRIAGVRSTGHPHYPLMCRITPGTPALCEIVFDTQRIAPALASELLEQVLLLLAWLPASLDRPVAALAARLAQARARRADERRHALGRRLGAVKRRAVGATGGARESQEDSSS